MTETAFDFIMIKPSHYDDDGYPIVWWRTILPSNSLAALNGLARDAAAREVLGPGRRLQPDPDRRVQPACRPGEDHPRHQAARREGADRAGRRPVEPVPPCARSRPRIPRRRAAGGDRRLPRLGLPVDAQGDPARDPGGARHGLLAVRRRGRGGPARRAVRRRLERRAEADLQLSQGPAEHRRRALSAGCRRNRSSAIQRPMVELRSRPRLPVPVQLLHDHQRPGPQEPLPHRRRSRSDHPRESGAGDQGLLHHRRQSRPQPRLGELLRPADPAARGGGAQGQPHHPGRHALPPHPELHRQGEARRGDARLHRAREHQPGQSARRQQAPEQDHRISPHASSNGTSAASSRSPATSSASPATPRNRSCATSRSSSASCRSTSSNSSS